nr:PREDICTED: macrophage mannose receptor 1-like [Latimeria chalumnae]|eukprot:XP_014353329.1 PREDICTED: macrophage mannose receptor 1-like [Latimeria chalumnae]
MAMGSSVWKPRGPNSHEMIEGLLNEILKMDPANWSRHYLKYHYIKEKKNWFEAQKICRENYTDLVSITRQQEQDNIRNLVGSNIVWIGLYQNPWQWSNRDESSFQHWDINQPNNNGGKEDCVGMWLPKAEPESNNRETGKWNDFSCTTESYFLCYQEKLNLTLVKEKKTWREAFIYCRTNHTDLVSITGPEIQEQVAEVVNASTENRVWIGLHRESFFGYWFWMNEKVLDYKGRKLKGQTVFLQLDSWTETARTFGAVGVQVTSKIAADVIKEYILVESNLTWPDAQSYCRTHHTDLISIHNKEEVKTLLEKYGDVDVDFLWIGLWKNASKDQWTWSSGEPDKFTNWGDKQPDNYGKREDCVVMLGSSRWYSWWFGHWFNGWSGKWNDWFCNDPVRPFYYMCFTGSSSSGDLKYHLIKEKKTWFEARDTCRENYTDLVSITSQQELGEIQGITGRANIWIGMYQNPWQWSNGDEASFQSWDTNETHINADNVCVGMWLKNLTDKGDGCSSEIGRWAGFRCSANQTYFLCYEERELVLVKENRSWTDALLYCRKNHADLISITDPKVQKQVAELARNNSGDGVWIGLRRDILFGFWFWMDGDESDYTNWENGVQTDPQTDHCGYMDKTKNSTWGFQCCLTELNFICSNWR